MPASLRFEGILELKEELRNLPAHLKGQATAIVMENAYAAADDIRAQYPVGPTGNLRKGVKVLVKEIGPLAVAAQVRSTAPHAHLYEFGSEARHYMTKFGKKHETGRMWGKRPGKPVFIPTMIRYRRLMYEKFDAMLVAAGLRVTRDEAA